MASPVFETRISAATENAEAAYKLRSIYSPNTDLYFVELITPGEVNSGYRFVAWEDGEEQNPRSIVVTENGTFTAVFERKPTNPEDPTAIKEIQANTFIKIYPNPVVDGRLVIEYDPPQTNMQAEIYTAQGVLVNTSPLTGKKTLVDVSRLASGAYLVKVNNSIKKVIINNK